MNRAVTSLLFFMALAGWSHLANAGVWTSGGSELIKDSANPWFLENTKVVKTCVIVDSELFHTVNGSPEDIRRSIAAALEYWHREFAKSWSVANLIHVATQDFVESAFIIVGRDKKLPTPCPADAKLAIQLGWLANEQSEYLLSHGHRPGDLVAIAVRTDYDLKKMVANGFIYVAADDGAWSPSGDTIAQHPWKLGKGQLLTEVLKHEFGHVFGLPHMGIEGPMAADYAERCLQKGSAEHLAETGSNDAFFKIEGRYSIRHQCYPKKSGMRSGWRKFLGSPIDHNCVDVTLDKDQIKFATGPELNHLTERGTLKFTGQERFTWQDAVRVYLPAGEIALPCPDPNIGAGVCPWLVGPMIKVTDRVGTFTSTDGKLKRQVALTLSPLGLGFAQSKFSAEIDNAWHWNLDWEY